MANKLFEYQKGTQKLVIYEKYLEYGTLVTTVVPIDKITKVILGLVSLNIITMGSEFHYLLMFAPNGTKKEARDIILKLL